MYQIPIESFLCFKRARSPSKVVVIDYALNQLWLAMQQKTTRAVNIYKVLKKDHTHFSEWIEKVTDRCSWRTSQCPPTSCARGSSGSLTVCRSSGEERKAPRPPGCCSCPARLRFLVLWAEICDLRRVRHLSHCPSPPQPAPDLSEQTAAITHLQLLHRIE